MVPDRVAGALFAPSLSPSAPLSTTSLIDQCNNTYWGCWSQQHNGQIIAEED